MAWVKQRVLESLPTGLSLKEKVVLGAADTFRAAAVDQLKLWGERE